MAAIVFPNARRRGLITLVVLVAACGIGVLVGHFGRWWVIPPWGWALLLGLAVAFPLLLFGSLAAYNFHLAWKSEALTNASRAWPTTQGKVLSSEIRAIRMLKGSDVYTPCVRYEYSVGGRRYENDVVAFGMTALRPMTRAEAYVAGRDAGALVSVHYNSDDPAMATLDTTSDQPAALRRSAWVFVGLAVFIYGLIAIGFIRS